MQLVILKRPCRCALLLSAFILGRLCVVQASSVLTSRIWCYLAGFSLFARSSEVPGVSRSSSDLERDKKMIGATEH